MGRGQHYTPAHHNPLKYTTFFTRIHTISVLFARLKLNSQVLDFN